MTSLVTRPTLYLPFSNLFSDMYKPAVGDGIAPDKASPSAELSIVESHRSDKTSLVLYQSIFVSTSILLALLRLEFCLDIRALFCVCRRYG